MRGGRIVPQRVEDRKVDRLWRDQDFMEVPFYDLEEHT